MLQANISLPRHDKHSRGWRFPIMENLLIAVTIAATISRELRGWIELRILMIKEMEKDSSFKPPLSYLFWGNLIINNRLLII